MDGRAEAPAAGTVLNALATGTGSAFAIDEYVRATVTLGGATVEGTVAGVPDADTNLIERAAERVLEEYADGGWDGATVETESDVPMASGLKSSSAAANATVLATLEALEAVDWDVVVWTPPEQAFSADADVERCRRVAPMADLVAELALAGRYRTAMTVNGFAFAAALERPTEPMVAALPAADGVSLSGTGPSYVAVGERDALDAVADAWTDRPGTVTETTTQTTGARPI